MAIPNKVIEIRTLGPQGPIGPQGPSGSGNAFVDALGSGNFITFITQNGSAVPILFNNFLGTAQTSSFITTASVNLNTITFTKGDNTTFLITVNTGSGGGGGGVGTLQQVTTQGASTTIPITASIISASNSITGSLFGTASFAKSSDISSLSYLANIAISSDKIKLTDTTADTDYGFVLKDGSGIGYFDLYQDSQVDTPAWNPSTNTFKASIISASSGFTGSLFGTASWAVNVVNGGSGFTPSLTTNLTAQNITASANISASGILSIGGIPNVSASIASLNVGTGTLQTVTTNGASTTIPITASIISASSFTGSLFGTSSWATNALTASYVLNAVSSSFATTSSHALNGGVTQITAGDGIAIDQSIGNVTITSTGGGGSVGTLSQVTALGASTTIPITASIISASSGITGSLFGTASWADNVISASYALTASYYQETDPIFIAKSASLATTGSNIFIGNQTITGSLIQGLEGNIATGEHSHAEGSITKAIGNYSHAEGDNTQAKGDYSHAEGQETIASGSYSHTEGYGAIARGQSSHAEGRNTQAIGNFSHAEGDTTIAQGLASHAEGVATVAAGSNSHAEGILTSASANYSHAEGQQTQAIGEASHAEGLGTIASGSYQHVQGQWNATSPVQSAFIVGNGTNGNNRSNLIHAAGNEVQISGSMIFSAGGITGSLFGTASWATNALTTSFAPNYLLVSQTSSFVTNDQTSSFILNSQTSSMTVLSSSFSLTSSLANRNILTASVNSNTLFFTKGDGTQFSLTVNTGSGEGVTLGGDNNSGNLITATGTNEIYGEVNLTFKSPVLSVSNGIVATKFVRFSSSLAKGSSDGLIINYGSTSTVEGYLYYLSSSNIWVTSSLTLTSGSLLAIATSTNSSGGMLLQGISSHPDLDNLTPGATIYLSGSGRVSQTAPTTSNQQVRVIGYGLSGSTFVFNPSTEYVTLA